MRHLCQSGGSIGDAYQAFLGYSEDAIKKMYYKQIERRPLPRPNFKTREEWTEAEDNRLRAAVQQHGPHWRTIAALFDTRSDSSLRNRAKRLQIAEGCAPHARSEGEVVAIPSGLAQAMAAPVHVAHEVTSRPKRPRLGPSGKPVRWACMTGPRDCVLYD